MSQDAFRAVATLADIPMGKTRCVSLADKEILICHTKEGVFAVDNLCTHAEARLSEGKLKACRILCPLHGAAFDVRSGDALSRPATIPLGTYPTKMGGDDILLCMG